MEQVGQDNEERFAEFLRDTVREMDPRPAAVPRDAMWAAISARRHGDGQVELLPALSATPLKQAPVRTPMRRMREVPLRFAVPAAFALAFGGIVAGVSLGRGHLARTPVTVAEGGVAGGASGAGVASPSTPAPVSTLPAQVATAEHFAEAEQMLAKFASAEKRGGESAAYDAKMAAWARDLLATTQVLLDSRAAQDPQRRRLLSDLELVLVQIVEMAPDPLPEDREMVAHAITHSQMIQRLQYATPAAVHGPVGGA